MPRNTRNIKRKARRGHIVTQVLQGFNPLHLLDRCIGRPLSPRSTQHELMRAWCSRAGSALPAAVGDRPSPLAAAGRPTDRRLGPPVRGAKTPGRAPAGTKGAWQRPRAPGAGAPPAHLLERQRQPRDVAPRPEREDLRGPSVLAQELPEPGGLGRHRRPCCCRCCWRWGGGRVAGPRLVAGERAVEGVAAADVEHPGQPRHEDPEHQVVSKEQALRGLVGSSSPALG